MKKSKMLATQTYDCDFYETQVIDPIKLDGKDLKALIVKVHGYEFIDTGYAYACPKCGLISGISCRQDLDKTVDFFLKFGCEHYEIKK